MEGTSYYWGTGRRKTAIARVRLKKGTGQLLVNNMAVEKYFDTESARQSVLLPLQKLDILGRYDIYAELYGGGKPAQADALVLGIARALKQVDPSMEPTLRKEGLLTRDPRMKERKKYGLHGARRTPQYSKR